MNMELLRYGIVGSGFVSRFHLRERVGKRLRLLRDVGMRWAGIYLELAQHLSTERIVRQHAAHGVLEESVGMAGDLGLGDRVVFTGFRRDERDVLRLLALADLFCLPTRREGFGVAAVLCLRSKSIVELVLELIPRPHNEPATCAG